MVSAIWVVVALAITIVLTSWITFTLTRLDRLHARVDAAQAALDAQLVRRAAALLYLAEEVGSAIPIEVATEVATAARQALSVTDPRRQAVENRVGKALSELGHWQPDLGVEGALELSEASTRVVIARRFYNDAVRDTRTLRARRMPRLLHLAGHRELPAYFDIDDSVLVTQWPAPLTQPPIG